ncbi:hypothetical protein Ddc_18793 [Ditylenchus destructor]|nr:hypothetical protein Ddc_18793 [Ditylenchus destructor]
MQARGRRAVRRTGTFQPLQPLAERAQGAILADQPAPVEGQPQTETATGGLVGAQPRLRRQPRRVPQHQLGQRQQQHRRQRPRGQPRRPVGRQAQRAPLTAGDHRQIAVQQRGLGFQRHAAFAQPRQRHAQMADQPFHLFRRLGLALLIGALDVDQRVEEELRFHLRLQRGQTRGGSVALHGALLAQQDLQPRARAPAAQHRLVPGHRQAGGDADDQAFADEQRHEPVVEQLGRDRAQQHRGAQPRDAPGLSTALRLAGSQASRMTSATSSGVNS